MNPSFAVLGIILMVLGLRRVFMVDAITQANIRRAKRLQERTPWLYKLIWSELWVGGEDRARVFTRLGGMVALVGGLFVLIRAFTL